MKIVLNKKALNINPDRFLRGAGYGFITDRQYTGKSSYVRRLGSGHYPRLHMYFDESGDRITFSLHLDQKKASYAGSHMHSAEYDGNIVEGEINRLRDLLRGARPIVENFNTDDTSKGKDVLKEMGERKIGEVKKRRGWLAKLLNINS